MFAVRLHRNRTIFAIASANFHRRPEIAAISSTHLNKETLRFKNCKFHRLRLRYHSANAEPKSRSFAISWGPVSAHLLVVAPGNPSCAFPCSVAVCELALRVCDSVWSYVMVLSCLQFVPTFVSFSEGAKRQNFLWGHNTVSEPCMLLRFRGRLPWWGSLGSSVPRSPGATLQRSGAAHGPLHPAVFFSKLCFCVFGILLGFWLCVWEI